MNQKMMITQNDAKFKNALSSLWLITILTALNLFLPYFADIYFLFSAYLPLLFTSIGFNMYLENGLIIFYIITLVIGIIFTVPYLLCAIFGKKKVGWIIAALIYFSLDSLVFLVDFFYFLSIGDYSFIFDLLIRIWALISLIQCVVYGVKASKNPPTPAFGMPGTPGVPFAGNNTYTQEGNVSQGVQRTITIVRKKSFVASAAVFVCCVNGVEVGRVKNGKTITFTVSEDSFELGVMLSNGFGTGTMNVPAGYDNLTYNVSAKMGMTASTIIIEPANPASV